LALKLYVWRGDGVLQDYTSGIAFALADSAEQARTLLRESIETDQGFLGKEPEVFDTPAALWVYGGG
jgi:hypothetical protein